MPEPQFEVSSGGKPAKEAAESKVEREWPNFSEELRERVLAAVKIEDPSKRSAQLEWIKRTAVSDFDQAFRLQPDNSHDDRLERGHIKAELWKIIELAIQTIINEETK